MSVKLIPEATRKKRAYEKLVEAEEAIAQTMDWTANYPIVSGNASGLYNISTGTKEYKFVDVNVNNAIVPLGTAPATFTLLNGLQLGTAALLKYGTSGL